MTPTSSYKDALEKVRCMADAGHYHQAFAEIDGLLRIWPDNPHVLVQWANLLQMQEADVGPPLEEARAALQRAADLDEQAPMPLIQLGQFLYALDDDAEGASRCFAKAIALCKGLLREALQAQAKALAELSRPGEALACLSESHWLQTHQDGATIGASCQELLEQVRDLVSAE